MRKVFSILGISALFVSCNKDNIKQSGSSQLASTMSTGVTTPVLNITTLEDYQTTFEQEEGTSVENKPDGFVSLKSVIDELENAKLSDSTGENYWNHPQLADTIFEDYGRLLDVLNKDKIIQLNEHFVKVDLHKNSVYVIPASVENAYGILTSETGAHDELVAYPTYMEVGLQLFGLNIFTCKEGFATQNTEKGTNNNCSNSKRTVKKVT